ncbi:MAG: hypothetical protein M1816_002386 [Peltula sp. TS41687]|nr:MAG: hypothetical protein M1816_002386 [Peltula sp. TS41687]
MEELSTITKKSVHGQVYHLRKPDYTRDVTEASRSGYVLVHLTSSSSSNVESRLLTERWRELASVFGDVKFCEIQGDMCIEGYPEKNCPTILVYRDGEIVRQLLTLRELNGPRTTQADLGNLLVGVGAVKADDVRVIRLRRGHDDAKMRAEAEKEDESDNDWD